MKDTHTLLVEARDAIRSGWTKFAPARNKAGKRVDILDGSATCWCLTGSLDRVYFQDPDTHWGGPDELHPLRVAHELLVRFVPKTEYGIVATLADYNDLPSTTREDVIAMFDKAIEGIQV